MKKEKQFHGEYTDKPPKKKEPAALILGYVIAIFLGGALIVGAYAIYKYVERFLMNF